MELESSLPGEQRVMSEENTTKFRLDEKNLPRLSKSQARRLDSMRDEEIEKAALSDPDNPPLTDEELAAFERVPDTKAIRKALSLTQREFATTFQLSLATVRDWEQGRYQPDQAARTLLRGNRLRDPKAVKRARQETAIKLWMELLEVTRPLTGSVTRRRF